MALNVNDNELTFSMILEETRKVNLEFGEILYRMENKQLTYIRSLEKVINAADLVSKTIHDINFLTHFKAMTEALEELKKCKT